MSIISNKINAFQSYVDAIDTFLGYVDFFKQNQRVLKTCRFKQHIPEISSFFDDVTTHPKNMSFQTTHTRNK